MGWGVNDYPGEPKQAPIPKCPVCGMETDTFYKDAYGDIVGCDNCISAVDAWDYVEDE